MPEIRIPKPKFDSKILGDGAESSVFVTAKDSKKVAAFEHERKLSPSSALRAKRIFYLQKILHTLFPQNFPKIHDAFGKHPDENVENNTGTIRERILMDGECDDNPLPHILMRKRCDPKHRIECLSASKSIERLLEPIGMQHVIDYGSNLNFISNSDGMYYVDLPMNVESNKSLQIHPEKIAIFMEKNNYSDQDKRTVQQSIARLKEVLKEYGEDVDRHISD